MKTLVLHIGYPKTGTSSLQWFLHTHREALRRQGVCYPVTGQAADHAHHKLAFSLTDNNYETWSEAQRIQLFEQLAAEIDRGDANTIVLSSELFLDRLEHIRTSKEFGAILDGCSLRVICVLRRQSTFLESLYRQFIWDTTHRLTDDPDVFLTRYPWVGDYHTVLSRWAGFVGKENIEPVVYEQARNAEGCIKRFCGLVGVDTGTMGEDDFDVAKNVLPAATLATEVMRISNAYEGLSIEQRHELAGNARRFAESIDHLPLPTRLFSPAHVSQVESMYMESNRKLAEDFVHQPLDGFWFREDSAAAET